MQLYVLAPQEGAPKPVYIGVARDAEKMIKVVAKAPHPALRERPLAVVFSEEIPAGWEKVADQIMAKRLETFNAGDGWYEVLARTAVNYARQAVLDASPAIDPVRLESTRASASRFVKWIRESWGLSAAAFGEIAGVVKSTVSRWEAEEHEPGMGELARLRAWGRQRGLPWEDSLLFEFAEPEVIEEEKAA